METPNYDKVMELYKEISAMGYKQEADYVMSEISKKYTPENPAPPELIQKGLETILAKKHSGLEETVDKSSNYAKAVRPTEYAVYMGILGAILLYIAL